MYTVTSNDKSCVVEHLTNTFVAPMVVKILTKYLLRLMQLTARGFAVNKAKQLTLTASKGNKVKGSIAVCPHTNNIPKHT